VTTPDTRAGQLALLDWPSQDYSGWRQSATDLIRNIEREARVLETVSEQRIRQLEHHVEVLCATIEDIVANPETVGIDWTAEKWEAIRIAMGNARAVIEAYA
jgi:hypothetical protein